MNFRFVANQLGLLMMVLSAVLLVISGWVAFDVYTSDSGPETLHAIWITTCIGFAGGGAMWLIGWRQSKLFGRREAMLLVSSAWLVGAALAALPFWFWANLSEAVADTHPFQHYVDCYFEAMSGLTTTGATILGDIDALPRGLLFWRAMTHWLGGIGIVVLFVSILPAIGVGGKQIFHVEAAGPKQTGIQPRIHETARTLWVIYLTLTAAQIFGLRACGMGWFDSVCHTFSTVATGGFSTHTASVGAFVGTNHLAINTIIILFMVLAGVNFGLYHKLIRGSWRDVLRDTELRVYLSMLLIGSAVVVGSLVFNNEPIALTEMTYQQATAFEVNQAKPIEIESNLANSIEQGVFTTISLQTGTGFGTANYNHWPFVAVAVLVAIMFVGGCAGSTTGGLKVLRVWLVFRILYHELEKTFRPNVIRPTKTSAGSIDPDLKQSILIYVIVVVILFAIGSCLVMMLEAGRCKYTTAATASVATLCNVGPGLARIGALENYGWMSGPTKMLLSIMMALGRLEIFPMLIMFVPGFWRRH